MLQHYIISDPPPHTHYKAKKMKNSTLECKENDQMQRISHEKNVNKSKIHCSPVKLEIKKQGKTILARREKLGLEVSIERECFFKNSFCPYIGKIK